MVYNITVERKMYFFFFAVKKHIFILIQLLFSASCRSGAGGSTRPKKSLSPTFIYKLEAQFRTAVRSQQQVVS